MHAIIVEILGILPENAQSHKRKEKDNPEKIEERVTDNSDKTVDKEMREFNATIVEKMATSPEIAKMVIIV